MSSQQKPSEKVMLSLYDDKWPILYAKERDRLNLALPELLLTTHHVGSTAIHGMIAKPIIDILAETGKLDQIDLLSEVFGMLGYEPKGEYGIKGRRYFRMVADDSKHLFHLHIFQIGSTHARQILKFRNKLMSLPNIASEYAQLKTRLANEQQLDKSQYQKGKNEFILRVLREA